MELHIREATEADLPAIVDIYNQSIPAGWSTADTKPIAVADRVEWFRKFDPARRPIWVAEADGRVVATAYLSSFYGGRPAYDAKGTTWSVPVKLKPDWSYELMLNAGRFMSFRSREGVPLAPVAVKFTTVKESAVSPRQKQPADKSDAGKAD